MRILFINLARATDRCRLMQDQFRELGIVADRLEAVDGRNLTAADRQLVDNARRRWHSHYPLSDNEIGCCLSHRMAMLSMIRNNENIIAILEDDCIILPDFRRVLEAIEECHERGEKFDLIDLKPLPFIGRFHPCYQLFPGIELGQTLGSGVSNLAYVITKPGAIKYLRHYPRLCYTIDTEMRRWWENGLGIYCLSREVIRPSGAASYIDETRNEDRPDRRQSYLDADALRWRLARQTHRVYDSIRKRAGFPGYLRRGRRLVR